MGPPVLPLTFPGPPGYSGDQDSDNSHFPEEEDTPGVRSGNLELSY